MAGASGTGLAGACIPCCEKIVDGPEISDRIDSWELAGALSVRLGKSVRFGKSVRLGKLVVGAGGTPSGCIRGLATT